MNQYQIEEIILRMADIVMENRTLRRENNELRLTVKRHEAFTASLVGSENGIAKKQYDILMDIERNNSSVSLCNSMGWGTSERYIEDWEGELERRLKQNEEEMQ